MKAIFVARTGKGGGINVADEVEQRLKQANLLPGRRKIPRSTLNRLLSAEPFRNRLGFSVRQGRFEFTHNEGVVLTAMARVAEDLANQKLVLGDIWDVDGKREYLNRLDREGILPTATEAISRARVQSPSPKPQPAKPSAIVRPTARTTLIPQTDFSIVWPGRLQRHHEIWEELQFRLNLSSHPNAISVLLRVLLELSVENYVRQTGLAVQVGDKLAARALKVCNDLHSNRKIDEKQLGVIKKFQQLDQLVSADTLNRYVHSFDFAPSPEHLRSLWDSLANFIVQCLIV